MCDQQAGFAWRQLPYDLAGSREGVEENLEAGKLEAMSYLQPGWDPLPCISHHVALPA